MVGFVMIPKPQTDVLYRTWYMEGWTNDIHRSLGNKTESFETRCPLHTIPGIARSRNKCREV